MVSVNNECITGWRNYDVLDASIAVEAVVENNNVSQIRVWTTIIVL